jgi:hypothetical protein
MKQAAIPEVAWVKKQRGKWYESCELVARLVIGANAYNLSVSPWDARHDAYPWTVEVEQLEQPEQSMIVGSGRERTGHAAQEAAVRCARRRAREAVKS